MTSFIGVTTMCLNSFTGRECSLEAEGTLWDFHTLLESIIVLIGTRISMSRQLRGLWLTRSKWIATVKNDTGPCMLQEIYLGLLVLAARIGLD